MSTAHLDDILPALAAGRRAATADEDAHLAACAACRDELALLQSVRAIGDEAPTVDPATIAATVLPRVAAARRAERQPRRRWPQVLGLAAAAGMLFAVWPSPSRSAAEPALQVAELDGLDAEGLQEVLAAVDAGLPEAGEGTPIPADTMLIEAVFDGREG